MPITFEFLALLIGIAVPLFGGAFAVWRMIEKRVTEKLNGVEQQIDLMKEERKRIVEERKEAEQGLVKRVDKLESTTVNREDYLMDRQSTDRAIESIALSLREGLNTVTQRIDLVLFEIGRNNGKKD